MKPLQISMLFNIGSILLGICSWFFAGYALASQKVRISYRRSFLSFLCCMISLVFQVFEIGNRVAVRDFAAIGDTINAVMIASVALLTVTVFLNMAAMRKAKKLP